MTHINSELSHDFKHITCLTVSGCLNLVIVRPDNEKSLSEQ